MNDPTLPLPGLSPVSGRTIVAKFDGGLLSSDGGILVLREVEQRLRVADRMAACIEDPRAPDQITHTLADIIRFRLLMISAGYEDGADANSLRSDPMFKMALDLSPSDRELCSQSTISRLENLPNVRALLRMGRAMVDLYCESFQKVPKRITLDIDDTFDAVHGGQQLRLFNAHYDEYGFQPIVVFDGEGRFITAVLRPAKRPGGKEIKAFLRRLLRAIRANWPNTEILLRADSHYCCPEVLDFCRANGLDYSLRVGQSETGSQAVPLQGLGKVLRHALAIRIHVAEFVLCIGLPTIRQRPPDLQSCRVIMPLVRSLAVVKLSGRRDAKQNERQKAASKEGFDPLFHGSPASGRRTQHQ